MSVLTASMSNQVSADQRGEVDGHDVLFGSRWNNLCLQQVVTILAYIESEHCVRNWGGTKDLRSMAAHPKSCAIRSANEFGTAIL